MSYSVNQKCNTCKKESKCADGLIIRNAVQGIIHQLPNVYVDGKSTGSHLGGGTVTHDCVNFENKEE